MVSVKRLVGIAFIILVAHIVFANDLVDKYEELMRKGSVQKISPEYQGTKNNWNPIASGIESISKLSKGVFESTEEFDERRKAAIVQLEDQMNIFSKNVGSDYQAGSLTMIEYDADNEILTARIAWSNALSTLLREINDIRQVRVYMPRSDAKQTFSEIKTHPIYITVKIEENSLALQSILLRSASNVVYIVHTNDKAYNSLRELEAAFDANYVPPPECYGDGSNGFVVKCGNHRIRARRDFIDSGGKVTPMLLGKWEESRPVNNDWRQDEAQDAQGNWSGDWGSEPLPVERRHWVDDL